MSTGVRFCYDTGGVVPNGGINRARSCRAALQEGQKQVIRLPGPSGACSQDLQQYSSLLTAQLCT